MKIPLSILFFYRKVSMARDLNKSFFWNCTMDTLQTTSSLKLATAMTLRFSTRDRSIAWMLKRVIQSSNDQRTFSKYGSDLEMRIPAKPITIKFNPSNVNNAYSHNMLSNSFKDLETGLLRVANGGADAEIHSRDLPAFSQSINERWID